MDDPIKRVLQLRAIIRNSVAYACFNGRPDKEGTATYFIGGSMTIDELSFNGRPDKEGTATRVARYSIGLAHAGFNGRPDKEGTATVVARLRYDYTRMFQWTTR